MTVEREIPQRRQYRTYRHDEWVVNELYHFLQLFTSGYDLEDGMSLKDLFLVIV
jgi:hypothetical protein